MNGRKYNNLKNPISKNGFIPTRKDVLVWIVDIRHSINEKEEPGIPEVRENVEGIKAIVIYATLEAIGQNMEILTACWSPVSSKKKKCRGFLQVEFDEPERIHWKCSQCEFEGIVTGWAQLSWNKIRSIQDKWH